MDYSLWFADRLSQLRIQMGVSARDMSLSLGQSESYINKIENRRTMPSMNGFFYICDYLNILPHQFFNPDIPAPQLADDILLQISKLPPDKASHVLLLIKDLNGT